MSGKISRRAFNKAGAAATLGLTAAGYARAQGANERVRLGVIGTANRGGQLINAFLPHSDCEVVALCDVHEAALAKADQEHARKLFARDKEHAAALSKADQDHVRQLVAREEEHYEALEETRKQAQQAALEQAWRAYEVQAAERAEAHAAERPGAYDVVTCLEMLEHVPDPSRVIAACRELVRPGGHVFFSTINRNPKAFVMAIFGAEYVLRLLPRGTHQYAKLIRPSELGGWARDAGLDLQAFTGMHYNPFSRQTNLGGNVHVNYLAWCRRPEDE